MRAQLPRRVFRLAALAAFVFSTAWVASPAEARRLDGAAGQKEHGERYERWPSQGWIHEGNAWTKERSKRTRGRSAERRHVKRGQSVRTRAQRVDEGASQRMTMAAPEWWQEKSTDRPMRQGRGKRLRGQPQGVSQGPVANWGGSSADMPAYAYEPATQTSSDRIYRGHETANAPTRRRLAAAPETFEGGGGGLVAEARRWLGTNPTNRSSLWCAAFMNFVLQRAGHEGTGSNLAKSFASLGRRVSGPQVGAIAVMSRRGGGHVGVVSGVDSAGNPIIISGNSRGRKVAEHAYPRGRIYAYVMP
jgi:uncharacterized protein (TIGR02594 family)